MMFRMMMQRSILIQLACLALVGSANAYDFEACSKADCGEKCSSLNCAKECTGENCGQMCSSETCALSCKGENCGQECSGSSCAFYCAAENCGQKCSGANCAVKCTAENCGQMCSGTYCADQCTGENCGQMCSAKGCGQKCSGKNCANKCTGDFCGCECVGENCGASCTGENCGTTACCEGRKAYTCTDGTAPTYGAFCVDDATDAADKCIECNEGFSLTIAGNGRRHRRQLLYYGGDSSPSLIIEIPMDVCNNVDLASLSATEVAALKANLLQAAAAAGGFDIDDVGVEGVQFVQNGVQVRLRSQRATSNANDPIVAVLTFTEGSGADVDVAKGYADNFNIAVQAGSVSVSVTLDNGNTLSADVTKE